MSQTKQYTNLRVGVGKFFYGNGSLEVLPDEILRLGGKPLIIGGPTTIPLVLESVKETFARNAIAPLVYTHTAACSRSFAEYYSGIAKENGCTLILGIGGGKCLDLAKATATVGMMDLICVPTSVATCVASSSVCIMYHNDGTPDGSIAMHKEVDVVIADTQLIASAPKRTLAAGIFDSIAKYPEVIHNLSINSYLDCELEKYICAVNSKAIYDFLIGEGKNVYDNGLDSGRMTDVILTNLLHTSVVSGFSCGVNQLALAHGLYDCVRRSFTSEAKNMLHGEIVAVGVLMQLRFNQMPDSYISEVRDLMQYMSMPTCLSQLGIPVNHETLNIFEHYLIPATGLHDSDIPLLRKALEIIAR